MPVDPSLVQRISDATGFQAEIVEQILHLKSVLKMINDDPVLKGRFVLIGGTAINLFDKDIPRLSVDIDLDYVHKGRQSFTHDVIEKHLSRFQRIASSLDMSCYDKRTVDERSVDKLRLIFEYNANYSRDTGTVKLDISYLMKATIFKPVKRTMNLLHSSDPFKRFKLLVADTSELWAGKALALVYKTAKDPNKKEVSDLYSMQIARHLFDVSRFQYKLQRQNAAIDAKHLCLAFILKGSSRLRDLYLFSGEGIRKCSEKQIKTELDPYLKQLDNNTDGSPRPSLKKMIKLSREFLFKVCSNSWTNKEKQFVEEFQENSVYKPELLFGKRSQEYKRLSNNEYLRMAAKKMLGK